MKCNYNNINTIYYIKFKNIDSQTLLPRTVVNAGSYFKSRSWSSITVVSGSVMAFYNYKTVQI